MSPTSLYGHLNLNTSAPAGFYSSVTFEVCFKREIVLVDLFSLSEDFFPPEEAGIYLGKENSHHHRWRAACGHLETDSVDTHRSLSLIHVALTELCCLDEIQDVCHAIVIQGNEIGKQ